MLAKLLEPRAVQNASFITSVSDIQNAQMADRYPWLERERMAAVPIGSDPSDFDVVRKERSALIALDPAFIHFSYVGTVWPPVVESMRVFFRAVAALRNRRPEIYRRLRLNFVGTTANPNNSSDFRILPLAKMEGVEDIVFEVPQRIPYLEALSFLLRSNASLMIGSNEPHYTASKIYPYLMSGRPYLSLFHRMSSAHEILTAAGGGIALGFSSAQELEELPDKICDGLAKLAVEPGTVGVANHEIVMPYTARAIAGRYANIFDRLANEKKSAVS
jgi:hypothetical protein